MEAWSGDNDTVELDWFHWIFLWIVLVDEEEREQNFE